MRFNQYFTPLALMAALFATNVNPAASDPADTASLNADEMPTEPQETTASLGAPRHAEIHQWGIIRIAHIFSSKSPSAADLLSLPDFVHRRPITHALTWLDFSALYIHPPLQLKAPLEFDIRMNITSGTVKAWYPYATPKDSQVTWNAVQAGVQADGLLTTHTVWMGARAVASPATLKVYKPGPPNTRPDDPGTTEGDVFLFARAALASSPVRLRWSHHLPQPLAADDAVTIPLTGWIITRHKETSEEPGYNVIPLPLADQTPDQMAELSEDQFQDQPENQNPSDPPISSTEQVMSLFNEAFTGHGLTPDEATAFSRTILQAISRPHCRYGVAILPKEWATTALPLQITGSPAAAPVRVFVALIEL